MFQDFSAPLSSSKNQGRIDALRKAMTLSGVDGVLVPRADEHQGEYVPASAERLSWLTGFTGSAGIAAILAEKAAIFIDGRYEIQVQNQVDCNVITPIRIANQSLDQWLIAEIPEGAVLAYDPWLHPIAEIERLEKKLSNQAVRMLPHDNLVDEIWCERPAPPRGPVSIQPLQFCGVEMRDKIFAIKQELKKMGASAFLITQPDSLCWLFNIRGQDVPHTPLALGFAVVQSDQKPILFMNADKLDQTVRKYLTPVATLREPDELLPSLAQIAGRIALDASSAGMIFKTYIENKGGCILRKTDPCVLPKARKNNAELEGARSAHLRDGAAICQFLHWLEKQDFNHLDEITAAQHLETCRIRQGQADQQPLRDLSFDTISGFGENGAIIHYRVTQTTNKRFSPGSLYLIDSGGQYQDGTTDITRTLAIGKPSKAMRRHFTLVLKGMITLSRARFPEGTSGAQLDTLARLALWEAGYDFDHGTGHGVGSFLRVHEGPQRLSKLATQPLEEGMILSNEPGYYKAGAYGIRIENLMIVTAPETIKNGDRKMMGFETLTLAPIDKRLIDHTMLLASERDWLNAYHQRVYDRISPRLCTNEVQWLKQASAPLMDHEA